MISKLALTSGSRERIAPQSALGANRAGCHPANTAGVAAGGWLGHSCSGEEEVSSVISSAVLNPRDWRWVGSRVTMWPAQKLLIGLQYHHRKLMFWHCCFFTYFVRFMGAQYQ